MPAIMRIMRRSGQLAFSHDAYASMEYPIVVLVRFTLFCLKCIWMPEMCPAPRWIDYPAPRSPADSFVMAGPIRHCLLRACIRRGIIRHVQTEQTPDYVDGEYNSGQNCAIHAAMRRQHRPDRIWSTGGESYLRPSNALNMTRLVLCRITFKCRYAIDTRAAQHTLWNCLCANIYLLGHSISDQPPRSTNVWQLLRWPPPICLKFGSFVDIYYTKQKCKYSAM